MSPAELPLASLLPQVIDLAQAAGREILKIYQTDFEVAEKEDRSPLTEADMAAHHKISAGLTELEPKLPLLSEESASIPFSERASWGAYWLVDPLDGTKEFIKRNGEFTVNIALIAEHRPVLGVVYAPVLGLNYYAAEGVGAFKQEGDADPQPIRTRSVPSDRVAIVGSRSHRGDTLDRLLANVGEHDFLSMGSSLKLCLVAEGRADLYPRLGPTSEWDTAAAQGVVEGAGGRVVTVDGEPLRYNAKEEILNPHFVVIGDSSRDWLSLL